MRPALLHVSVNLEWRAWCLGVIVAEGLRFIVGPIVVHVRRGY